MGGGVSGKEGRNECIHAAKQFKKSTNQHATMQDKTPTTRALGIANNSKWLPSHVEY